jgi:acyl-homoserine lactone acylase PvdQ
MQDGGLQTADMRALFGEQLGAPVAVEGSTPQMPTGSNGFAIAPQRSADGTALLYINPHVSFYFRTEMHMVSEEGLNAYGAVTWGQFFVFQGFNERCGWMHTSSAVDVADLYAEKMERKEDRLYYHYDGTLRPFSEKELTLRYDEGGDKKSCTVKAYASHHGPVVGTRGGKWLTWKGKPFRVESLEQSWQRMKARGWDDFVRVLSLQANASTNTLYADADGNIAYWHGNFVPKRAGAVDPAGLLDGSVSSTDWQGLHSLQDLVHYRNPPGGFLQNCNSSPLTAAGQKLAQTYASYLAPEKDNFRSLHAIGELSKKVAFTPESLAALGYDTYLAAFDTLLPPLLSDLGALKREDSFYQVYREAADTLRNWSRRSAVHSVATTVAIFWAYDLLSQHGSYIGGESDAVKGMGELIRRCTYAERKAALWRTLSALDNLFGTWKVEWGRINRFQRTPGKLEQNFEESEDDFPVGLGPAFLGCLPSYETVFKNNRLYGVGGNSFVAVVSFGPRVKAKSISTGGQSFNPYSPHFLDQTSRFLTGQLKDVPFYREDVLKGARRSYHPGE